MAAPRPAKKGISKGAKIALIVGISTVVLVIAVIVVVAVLLIGALSAPADVANNYVLALNDGDLSTAWGYLSSEAQEEETRSGFNSGKKNFEGEIESYNTGSIEISNGNAQIVMDITFKDGEEDTWDMTLVKENGEWKIGYIGDG